MNRSLLLILILGLLLAGSAMVSWWMGGAVVVPQPSVHTEASSTRPVVTPEPSVMEAAVAAEVGEAVEADFAPEAEREEVVIEVDDSPLLHIQVWSGKRGRVAAEAEVFVLEGYKRSDPFSAFLPHRCEAAFEKGERYRASSEGRVQIPRLKGDAVVAARLSGAVGMVNVRKWRSEVDLVLQPDETVTVRVVDHRGRVVVGAPVGIQQRVVSRIELKDLERDWREVARRVESVQRRLDANPAQESLRRQLASLNRQREQLATQWSRFKRGPRSKEGADKRRRKNEPGKTPQARAAKRPLPLKKRVDIRARRKTDERGLAVFRHFQFYRVQPKSWWPKQDRDRFEAVMMVPLMKAVAMPFQGRPVPADTIELRMPATGSIALRTVDRDGRPFTHPVHGELRIFDHENPGWMRVPIRKKQNEREIVFPLVGLGLQFLSMCRLDDKDFRWRTPTFAGPQQPDERVVIDLVVAPDDPMLHGRLLNEAGIPVTNAKATFLINSMRGRLEGEEVLLDEAGRFHLPFQVLKSHLAPYRLQIREQPLREGVGSGRMPMLGLARTLGVLPESGVVDLGDLQLGLIPPITFGRVVNDLGEPVGGARVQLQRERERGGRSSRLRWEDEAFTEVRTDEAGDFWLYGDQESARYRLRVTAAEHFPFEEPGLPSREAARIELLRRSRVVGTVQLPEWLPSRRVKVELLSHLDTKRNRTDSIRDFLGKKFIYFDWTRPGVYSLTFRIEGSPDPFARVDNFEIKPAQQGEHPRLKDIDLGREIFRFEVYAVDEAGKSFTPKSPLLARVMRPNGNYSLVGFGWRRGRAEVLSSRSSLEVLPEEQGFRADRATLVAGRSEIRFTRIPKLSLRVPGLRQLCGDDPVFISLELIRGASVAEFDSSSRRMAKNVRRSSSSHATLRGNDTVKLKPVRDGRYRVLARLGDKQRGGLVSVVLGEVDVRMPIGGAPQVLTVGVNPQAVQKAAQEVARRAAAAAAKPPRSRK
jgi:hypothetical protein